MLERKINEGSTKTQDENETSKETCVRKRGQTHRRNTRNARSRIYRERKRDALDPLDATPVRPRPLRQVRDGSDSVRFGHEPYPGYGKSPPMETSPLALAAEPVVPAGSEKRDARDSAESVDRHNAASCETQLCFRRLCRAADGGRTNEEEAVGWVIG